MGISSDSGTELRDAIQPSESSPRAREETVAKGISAGSLSIGVAAKKRKGHVRFGLNVDRSRSAELRPGGVESTGNGRERGRGKRAGDKSGMEFLLRRKPEERGPRPRKSGFIAIIWHGARHGRLAFTLIVCYQLSEVSADVAFQTRGRVIG